MEGKLVEFIHDDEKNTTSFVVDSVEMAMWIDAQPPAWAKKLLEILNQRERLSER